MKLRHDGWLPLDGARVDNQATQRRQRIRPNTSRNLSPRDGDCDQSSENSPPPEDRVGLGQDRLQSSAAGTEDKVGRGL